ncbi:uncharacterized protein LOC131958135 [Physella acuta]|uniref:uncharacterized protein LOC131958135 n=1 Tax=Physella acuta TaxID=109671 RepID=UPI0027DD8670|nr:uncharacterized protein LOC131958135 [Physella acuta]
MGDRLETVSNLITETNRQLDVKHAQVCEVVEQFERRLLQVDQNVDNLSRVCKEVRQGNVKTSHGENNNGNVDAERNMFLKMVELESLVLQEKAALSGMKESLELLETDVKENSSLLSDLLAKQLGKDNVAGQLEKCYGEVRGLFTRCDEIASSLREMDSSVQEKCGRVPSVEVCRRMETLVTELPVLVEKCQGDCGNVWRTLCQVEENSTKLVDHLTQQYKELELKMNDISNKLQTIEQSHNTKRVAFTGYLSEGNKYKLGSTFDNYAPVWCEHFNSKTGEFTAPADGLYLTSVTFGESEAGRLEVGIYKKTVNDVTERKVHFVEASMAWTSACTVCAVEMSAGDKLYLKFEKSGKTVQFSGNSNFTCIKL